ncbi:MAG: MATE family efflux transporter [Bacillus sp. (in: Bacteria)]|nr:MATE family efflux transporter [Bacillus sp. (in: firmicutes)]
MNEKENKMSYMPVNKLMITMGIPMILSMMLQAVYNIVDSIFVGGISGSGEQALNALTLAFPVQMLMVAIGIGTGVGMGAVISMRLGAQNYEQAGKTAGNAFFLAVIIYVLFLFFGIFGVTAYIQSQTQNGLIAGMAVGYLRICCTLSFGIVFFSIFEKLLQAAGKSIYSTIAQVTGAVVNMIFDPIFIYGWLGMPALGVRGAAYATVLGQIVSLIIAAIFHFKKNTEIKNSLSYLKPSIHLIREIYAIGLPAIIAQALMSVMTYGLNRILVTIDESVVTAYGLFYKIQQFILFAAFGLRDAITPIVSFNYGKRDKTRIQNGIKYGLLDTLVIMLIGTFLLEILAKPFPALFGLTGNTKEICSGAMRIISLSFVFAGANVAFQGIFQALEAGLESLIISICRQFLFVLPTAWLFSKIAANNTAMTWVVWLTFIIAESISCLISVLFMKRIKKQKINPLTLSEKIC